MTGLLGQRRSRAGGTSAVSDRKRSASVEREGQRAQRTCDEDQLDSLRERKRGRATREQSKMRVRCCRASKEAEEQGDRGGSCTGASGSSW